MGVLAHRKNTKVVSHPCGKTCWLSLSWQWEPTKGQLGRWVSDIHLLVFWQDLSLVRSLCVRGGFLVRRIQQERPLPGPNTQSRMKSLEAPRDEFLVVHLVRGCNQPFPQQCPAFRGFISCVVSCSACYTAQSLLEILLKQHPTDPFDPFAPQGASSYFSIQFSVHPRLFSLLPSQSENITSFSASNVQLNA